MDLDRTTQILDADWCRELVPGRAYFCVWYFEPGVNIPEVQTLIYLGVGNHDDDTPAYFFQAAESFCAVGDWSLLDEGTRAQVSAESIATFTADAVGSVADIDGLVVLISGLAKRMKLGIGWDRVLPDD